jgi:type I restriction enzyme S subunit
MSIGTISPPRAFAIKFSNCGRWDPISYHRIDWHWPPDTFAPLGIFFDPRREKVDRKSHRFSDLMPITIHFDGSIEPRKVDASKKYSMELFWARPGDIVVSKIDLKNGAVAIVPENWDNVVVTGHFAVYKPNKQLIDSEFFHLLIQAKFFKDYLWKNKVGAEGRKEVKLDFFESIKIPKLPITIQQNIVDCWKASNNEVSNTNRRFSELICNLNQSLIQNTRAYRRLKNSRVFVASYSKARQWDVKAGRSAAFQTANPKFVRLGEFTKECTELVRPWEEPEKEWPIYGVNNKDGVFLNTYQKGKDFNAPYKRIEKNWFFHNPTRANVGSLGIVPEIPEDAITSPEYQVWRLHLGFLPDFMALIIRTEYFLSLVDFNRVGGVKQRMYYANLAEIRLPMIDLEIQKEFADQRVAIRSAITKANESVKDCRAEIEEMILGLRPVEDI